MMRRSLLFFTSCLVLTGCDAVSNAFDEQKTTPVVEAAALSQTPHWWQVFNDPLMDSLADQLRAQNIDIKIAQARVDAARGAERVAESGWFPDVSVDGSAKRGNDQLGARSPIGIAKGGFEASWELDVFGRTRSQVSAAENRVDASVASVEDVRNSVLADLFKAVIQWRQAQQTVKETNALLAAQKDQVKLFGSRVKAGLADASFLERAQAEYTQTATQLPIAQAQADAAEFQMERLLGKASGELHTLLAEQQAQDLSVPPANAAIDVPMDTIRTRPDIRAAKANLLAAQADLAEAEANLWPRITVSGFFGAQATSGALPAADNPIWSLASGLTAPVLNFGKLHGAVDIGNAQAMEASLAYENATLTAMQEARTALSDYLNGINAVNRQQETLRHRRDAVGLAGERFQRGLTDMTDLITAQAELDNATLALIDKKANTAIAFIRLQKALGVGI